MQIPKVLLVNDDQASLYALESLLLEAAGQQVYELISAGSGKEALRQVLLNEFAVILLDVSMPGMDGFETAEAIHSHPRSAGTPIIFITAHYADEINRLKGYQRGAADYLFTPVIPQILQAKVAVFVEMSKKNMLMRRQAEELARLNQDLRVQRLQDLERINAELEQEIRERKQAELRAHELSTRDALTNLLNRRALIQQLEHAVATADRSGVGFALLFLDLDKFKPINDTYGHEVGDELLRQVAARLTAAVRVADIVARLGGDEFVVLIEGKSASANAARVGRKIEMACGLPFDIGAHRLKTAASIGIALYPQDGADAQALMKNADTAMYHAKQHGATPVQFFHEELNVREREREQWTLELRKALAAGQLELRYQPQVDLHSGQITAAEALLYWRHPQRGLLDAPQFLPQVQERALLERVDAWVIGQSCAQASLWQSLHRGGHGGQSGAPLCIWLNLAAPQLHAEVAHALLPAMRRHGLAPGSIGIELHEKLLLGAAEPLGQLLTQLQNAGVRVALDDFGSARSSLAACKRWQLNVLKIDRHFVHGIGVDEGGADLVAAVIHLARALAMRTVAIGVETRAQLETLRALGCHAAQGDLFYPPLPAASLLEQGGGADFPSKTPSLLNNED
ncbi:putative bifunctional diguanylate cyclase/phosphodiesterase [Duganella callida]|uniref:EAL domain-containing protein n=1 Tax=Duganella callida TaxID=2561932 RepID=A0A4Y9SGE9_9BURK|nr:EAL domain-containing protein [Duganella callida]TFW23035.1 EAL domain-containing protein [Duganella callida]